VAEVTVATVGDRDAVVRTVVSAFVDDPAFRMFFPDDAGYPAHAAAFAGWLFAGRVAEGTVWHVHNAAAVSMWEPPDRSGTRAPMSDMDLPPDALQRLSDYEHAVAPLLPLHRHWYLGVLATAPEHAGRGLGRAVMQAGLDRAAADGLPSVLETTNPDNLAMYAHLGWHVTGSTEVGTMTVWVLQHPPDRDGS
jgi:ribosomal protein S18 acetylase RimI-like enzyme